MMATLMWLQNSGGPDSIPIIGIGAFVALLNAGVTFGIVKGKTDSMSDAFKAFREDNDAFKTEVRLALAEIRKDMGSIQRSVGRLEGARERSDDS